MALTALLLPGLRVTSIFGPFLAVIAIAFLNATLWDAALFFKIPDGMHIQAALLLLVNGIIFLVVVKAMPGIEIRGVIPAILAPVIFTVSSMLIEEHGRDVNWNKVYEAVEQQAHQIKELFQDKRRAQPQ